jgi:proteasome accessory factor C
VAERRRAAPKTSERLGRMLVIVPYLVQHQGAALKEVGSLFGVPEDQLRRDLNLLFMSGLPPYGPGDLIDVDVDEEDRIWISMAAHFSRPLRLSRSEALALYLRGVELVATPGVPDAPALASALVKLRESLGADALSAAEERIEAAVIDERTPEHLDLLRAAIRDRRRVRMTYFSASAGAWTERSIEPEELFSSLGHWYVAAWDPDADGERLFRADRIRDAASTDITFEPRGLQGAGRPLYTPTERDVPVRLRLQPAGRWIAEYYAIIDPQEGGDGTLEVTLPARQLGWVARLLLRVGPAAEVVEPPELTSLVRELAAATLERYAP